MAALAALGLLAQAPAAKGPVQVRRHHVRQRIFASSSDVALLRYPEGLTATEQHVFVGTYNFTSAKDNRIFVFDANTGELQHTIGGTSAQELVSAGAILGLSIQPDTTDLYANSNGTGNVLRIRRPASGDPEVSIYSSFPTGTDQPPGPEDMAWHEKGWLYASDSNNRRLYAIPPGGGAPKLMIGPQGSGAVFTDHDLFAQPEPGFAPNGLVFSLDFRTLYAANTDADAVIAMEVNSDGMLTGGISTLAQNINDDFTEDPKGFEELRKPDTKIGISAATPLNGPDGLALDALGRIWVASVFGDNLTVLDAQTGRILQTVGSSAVVQGGLLRQPASLTFVGNRILATNLGLFHDATEPWSVAEFTVKTEGAAGDGNY
jgi:sugar lactone lactonase YvrE